MSKISEALREMAKGPLEIHSPSREWYRGIDSGEDITGKAINDRAEYLHACEAITQQIYIYQRLHERRPYAIYATNELLCVLQRGHRLVANAGKGDTFDGIPILPCAGSGRLFHFAEEVFELRERSGNG